MHHVHMFRSGITFVRQVLEILYMLCHYTSATVARYRGTYPEVIDCDVGVPAIDIVARDLSGVLEPLDEDALVGC